MRNCCNLRLGYEDHFSSKVHVFAVFGQKNGFRSCDDNSVFSRDLILKEVSELNGIVRIIVRSVCKQF